MWILSQYGCIYVLKNVILYHYSIFACILPDIMLDLSIMILALLSCTVLGNLIILQRMKIDKNRSMRPVLIWPKAKIVTSGL